MYKAAAESVGSSEDRPDRVAVGQATGPDMVRSATKRLIDVVLSTVLLLCALPAFCVVGLAVAADGGPILFVHRRVGRAGRSFGCLKFRTMHINADRIFAELLAKDPAAVDEWKTVRKLRQDPRVTCIGRLLRATSLDEAPQLWNVIRGDMSLVGPRPVVQEELDLHYVPAAAAMDYLSLRPGITGPWQVSGRSCVDYSQRVALDKAYARNPSLRTDLVLLVGTIGAVLRRRGAF